jgi:hypothetical protein
MDFPHRCTLERDVNGRDGPPERDGHQARRPDWRTAEEGVPCRFVTRTQRTVDLATGTGTVVTTYLLLLPARIELRPTIYRVRQITTRTGGLIEPGPCTITTLARRTGAAGGRSHISVSLELQGGRHAA